MLRMLECQGSIVRWSTPDGGMVGANAKVAGGFVGSGAALGLARVLDSRHNLRMILVQVLVFIFVSDTRIF